MTILGLLLAGWLRSRRVEGAGASDAPSTSSEAPVTLADPEPIKGLVPSALYETGRPFTDGPTPTSRWSWTPRYDWSPCPLQPTKGSSRRGMSAKAAWHRRRARAIAALVQAQDADLGWFHAEHLLDNRPTRLALFVRGPFDGAECRVDLEPPRIRVAHRPSGDGLEGAYLVQEVPRVIEPITLTVPAGAEISGKYCWDAELDHYEWVEE